VASTFFSGLPLYFGLQADGKQVHLANLSFSHLPAEPEARLAPAVLAVTATTPRVTDYFPEKHLCQWFRGQEAYRALAAHLGVDTVILVDGGTVSLDINDPINEFRLRCAAIRPPMAIPL
jgi:hypothetical protein